MNALSLLTPDEVQQLGALPSKAVCGHWATEDTRPEHFIENKVFADLMHTVIGRSWNSNSLTQAARGQKEGYLYIIDFRTPDGIFGKVPPEDIIGAFKVTNGQVVANSYEKNDSYKVYTKNGLVKLEPELYKLLLDELKK